MQFLSLPCCCYVRDFFLFRVCSHLCLQFVCASCLPSMFLLCRSGIFFGHYFGDPPVEWLDGSLCNIHEVFRNLRNHWLTCSHWISSPFLERYLISGNVFAWALFLMKYLSSHSSTYTFFGDKVWYKFLECLSITATYLNYNCCDLLSTLYLIFISSNKGQMSRYDAVSY